MPSFREQITNNMMDKELDILRGKGIPIPIAAQAAWKMAEKEIKDIQLTSKIIPEMKDWQFGIPLERLLKVGESYKHYNSFSRSPFSQVKKNDIAKAFHEANTIQNISGNAGVPLYYFFKIVKVRTPITMYGGKSNVVIGYKEPGDIFIYNFSGPANTTIEDTIFAMKDSIVDDKNYWFSIWEEDQDSKQIMKGLGFTKVGVKFTTFGEIYGIYYKRGTSKTALFSEDVKPVILIPPVEKISCMKITDINGSNLESLKDDFLKQIDETLDFKNHYSNYNDKNSWSAVSLRGYSSDPMIIEKPAEMNDKWQEKHKGEVFNLQNTPLMKLFPRIRDHIKNLEQKMFTEVHRVRFMKLSPGGGELKRHTDQVDPDAGNSLGKLIRLHYPIITNSNVIFTVWDYEGRERSYHMKEGEVWMLDTRKPHMVINGDRSFPRVHLVIDVKVTEPILTEIEGIFKNLNFGF